MSDDSARLDDLEQRFCNIARAQATELERVVRELVDSTRQRDELQRLLLQAERERDEARETDNERLGLCDKINAWKRRYYLVADAVAPESESAEQLADIAYQTRTDLDAANKEVARLRMIGERTCADWQADSARLEAQLARAVAALQSLVTCELAEDGAGLIQHLETARAILADGESEDAGEAWRELEAVYEAANAIVEHDIRATSGGELKPYEGANLRANLRGVVAKVDARRGQGAK